MKSSKSGNKGLLGNLFSSNRVSETNKQEMLDYSNGESSNANSRKSDPIDLVPRNVTVISASMNLSGLKTESNEDVVVFGRVMGDFKCAALYVAEGAFVDGKVSADYIRNLGHMNGNFESKIFVALKTSSINGEIKCKRFSSQGGCTIRARVDAENSDHLDDSTALPISQSETINPNVFKAKDFNLGSDEIDFSEKDRNVVRLERTAN